MKDRTKHIIMFLIAGGVAFVILFLLLEYFKNK